MFHDPVSWNGNTETLRTLDRIHVLSASAFFLMQYGDATYVICDGKFMMQFAPRPTDEPGRVTRKAYPLNTVARESRPGALSH